MFMIRNVENQTYGVKPMNCPGHCLMFDAINRSYKDLPIRYADFGVLHRNELSGALTGLTRVRRFQQDDAHIFITRSMIKEEMGKCLDFLDFIINKTFNMNYKLYLSTRPEGYLGELETWDDAENQLKEALTAFGKPFAID